MKHVKGLHLIRMIFDYWYNWITLNQDTIDWLRSGESSEDDWIQVHDDLTWYDGYNATFWYLLNIEWYRMNDKLFAGMHRKEVFESELIRDLDEDYIQKHYS